MRNRFLPVVAVALAGCASAPVTDVPRHLFTDGPFAAAPRPPVNEDIFAVSDAMRRFAATEIASEISRKGLQNGIAAAVRRDLRLEYDSSHTLPAADTFATRSGNCMSLVILSAAFAKHLDVQVTYQTVMGYDSWTRSDGIAFLSTHVNVRLGPRGLGGPAIDFVEPERLHRSVERPVDEDAVRAMYLNNRAAEAIVSDDLGTAYWWARAAIETAPQYTNGINTLAVIYLRSGRLRDAERALRHVLQREPENARALTNLIVLLERDGRDGEASAWRERLAAIEPYPPFYFLDQAQAALAQGDFRGARELLNKELRRMPYSDEVHFALALADLRVGDTDDARDHLALALKYSPTRDRRDIYNAKLARLKAEQGVH